MTELSELLSAYDAQLHDRVQEPLPKGVTVERDGPLVRFFDLFGAARSSNAWVSSQ